MNGGCFKCGARASCKHRQVQEPVRATEATFTTPPCPDKRKFNGTGYNFGGARAKSLKDALALFGKPA